jgi:hypothetical protein
MEDGNRIALLKKFTQSLKLCTHILCCLCFLYSDYLKNHEKMRIADIARFANHLHVQFKNSKKIIKVTAFAHTLRKINQS